MAIYETIDRKRAEAKEMKNKSASMEELETPTNSIKSFQMSATRFAAVVTLMVLTSVLVLMFLIVALYQCTLVSWWMVIFDPK